MIPGIKDCLARGMLLPALFLTMKDTPAQNSRFADTFLVRLPAEIGDWTRAEPHGLYLPENLYEYIDGGAELYLSYGFRALLSVTYESERKPPVRIDIFDMGIARNAFGLFTHSRETVEAEFGQGSQYFSGLLLFWKDRYFVSILCSPESDMSRKTVRDLGAMIDSAITATGELPELVCRLPQQGLKPESIRYFRHPIWLNTYYFIADEDLVLLDENSACVLAQYDQGIVLVIQYDDPAGAAGAYQNLTGKFLKQTAYAGDPVRMPDQTWAVSGVSGSHLYAIMDVRDRGMIPPLVEQLEQSLKDTGVGNEKKE